MKGCPFCGEEPELEAPGYGWRALTPSEPHCRWCGIQTSPETWKKRPREEKLCRAVRKALKFIESYTWADDEHKGVIASLKKSLRE